MDFGELVASAEQLTAEIDGVRAGDLPRVERSLKHILDAGQSLLSKGGRGQAKGTQDAKASILLGSRGVDLPMIASKIGAIQESSSIIAETETVRTGHTDIPAFLRAEREEAILGLLEETKKETVESLNTRHWDTVHREWETEKKRILAALSGGGGAEMAELSLAREVGTVSRLHDSSMQAGLGSRLSSTELQYAGAVVSYNESIARGALRPDFLANLQQLFKEEKEPEVASIWAMAVSLAGGSASRDAKQIVARAKSHLEGSYIKFVRLTVFSNLSAAALGGVPGTFPLVRSFLHLKVPPSTPGLDDGLVENVPVWAMVYYCLRCGDLTAAVQAAKLAGPGLSEAHSLLQELQASPLSRLSPQTESSLRLEYRRSVRQSSDPFKRAVYCILGACEPLAEHPEVATSLDDYLWLKLSQVREGEASTGDSLSLAGLQALLTEEYGEAHFSASSQPLLYFQVLFLTGQLEAAVDFLFRAGDSLAAHAVHLALALFELDLLNLPSNIQAPLLSRDPGDKPPSKRLNVARLVMLYVKHFESSDPREALQYFYFLRGMKGGRSENLFLSCVGELVLESREFDLLLGTLEKDGSRREGLVDRCGGIVDTGAIIELVARDSEERGLLEDAVRLYDLASKHQRVIELLNTLLSQVISAPAVAESRRDRLQRQAVAIAKRYREQGLVESRDSAATLFLLLDLATFFDLYHANKIQECLDTMARLKLLPSTQQEIDLRVSSFRVLGDEIRRNLPDILVGTMTSVHQVYSTMRSREGAAVERLREQARSIITYAGMIPYRLPGDTNARLVQMEVSMH